MILPRPLMGWLLSLLSVRLTRRLPLQLLVGLMICGTAAGAAGNDSQEADLARFTALLEAGHHAEAQRLAEDAWRRHQRGVFLFNLGVAQGRANNCQGALRTFQLYQTRFPSGRYARQAKQSSEALSACRFPTIFQILPAGESELQLDSGSPIVVRQARTTISLTLGRHTATVVREGFMPLTRDFEVKTGSTPTIVLQMSALPTKMVVAPTEVVTPADPVRPPTVTAKTKSTFHPAFGYTALGLGIGSLAVGLWGNWAYYSYTQDANDPDTRGDDWDQAVRLRDRGAKMTIAGYSMAALSLGASAFLFAW